jgi:hypothetical protein
VSSKTWLDVLQERFFETEPDMYDKLGRRFTLNEVRGKLLDLPEFFRDELIENIECLRSTLFNGWILDYNPFLKVLTITPELDLEATQFLQTRNKEILDRRISDTILAMSPYAFEEFVVDVFRTTRREDGTKKYSRVSLSKKTRDGGKDFKAFFLDETKSRRVLFGEVKHWSKPIDEKIIDRLSKVMERESKKLGKPPLGVVVSIVGASSIAKNTARNENIEVWDICTLIRLVKENGLGLKNISMTLPDASYWGEYDDL